jgi:hypothetical protein
MVYFLLPEYAIPFVVSDMLKGRIITPDLHDDEIRFRRL